ncbi:septation protein IspZ, partial [Pelagibacteraceae bacterium]|nr:septation protein IspZ [Pelagibacteraceae bacterium]
MNRSITKFIADFGPLLIFFTVYYYNENDLKVAIPPFVIATLISLGLIYITEKRIPMVPLVGGILITLFGGLTLYFDNKIFFYMKPTIVNLLFAGVLFFGKFFTDKPLLKKFFQGAFNLKDEGWKKLNTRWIYFFIFVALLNEIIWRT